VPARKPFENEPAKNPHTKTDYSLNIFSSSKHYEQRMNAFGFIVVGGGLAGCVVASRLRQREHSLSILLIEAGPDVTHHPYVKTPAEGALLHFSVLD
jgi:NADH dehydrogenase FAD-containing subunit